MKSTAKNISKEDIKEKSSENKKDLNDKNINDESSFSEDDKRYKDFIDMFFEKMSKKEGYSVTMGIFICLKNNNFLPILKEEIYEKIKAEFNKDPHKFIKYGKKNIFFENETALKQACYLSIMENQAFIKTKKNENIYITINYSETIEYLKSLKIHKINVPYDEEDMNYLFTTFKKKKIINNNAPTNINGIPIKKTRGKRGNVEIPKDSSLINRKRNRIEQIELSDDTGEEGGIYNINNSSSSFMDDILSRKRKSKISDKEKDNNSITPNSYKNNEDEFNEERKINDKSINNSSFNDNDNENYSSEFQNDIRIFKSQIKKIKSFLINENPKLDEMLQNFNQPKEKVNKINKNKENDIKYNNSINEIIKHKDLLQIIYLTLKDEIRCLKNVMDAENIFSKDIIEIHNDNIKNYENIYMDILKKLCEEIEYLGKRSNFNNKQKLFKEILVTGNIFKDNGIQMEELTDYSNDFKGVVFQEDKIFSVDEIKEYYESIKNKLIKKIEKVQQ